jgi:hypothetical protein
MPTVPGQSGSDTQLTVDVMLKQPTLISRRLANLVSKRLGAYKLCVVDPTPMVGASILYQQDESIYLDRDPAKSGPRGKWPRASWTEEAKSAAITEHGLEVPISNLAIRLNQKPQLTIALRKLANNIIKWIDGDLFDTILADAMGTQTMNASGSWTDPEATIKADIQEAQGMIETEDNGYDGFENALLVLNTIHRNSLLDNAELAALLPRETNSSSVQTGRVAPFLGIKDILYLSQMPEDKGLVLDNTVALMMAASQPVPEEGFQAFTDTLPGMLPIWVKTYKEEPKDTIIAGGIWPALASVAPRAIVRIDDITGS